MAIDVDLEFRDYYQEELYMSADVETGVLYNRSGRRMLALTDDFLIGLHRALEIECGDRAEQVIHRCGRRWGQNFGEGIAAEWSEFYGASFRTFPLAMFQSLLRQEFAHNGWGQLELHYEHLEKGIVWLSLRGAIMAAIRSDARDTKADILTAGILGGMYSFFLNRDLDCIQSQSEAEGFSDSRFVLSDATRIKELRSQVKSTDSHDEILCRLQTLAKTTTESEE